jgi:hypothetical protein
MDNNFENIDFAKILNDTLEVIMSEGLAKIDSLSDEEIERAFDENV